MTVACALGSRRWGRWRPEVTNTSDLFGVKGSRADPDCTERGRCHLLSASGRTRCCWSPRRAASPPAVRSVRQLFQTRVLAPAVVVFTRREDLEGASLHNYVRDTDNRAPRALVAECGGHLCALNNRTAAAEPRARVDELLARVEQLAREPPGAPFTNVVYRLAGTLATRPPTTG